MTRKRKLLNRHIKIFSILLGLLLLMSGCTKSAKNEKELVADLQKDPFFLCNLDITITDSNIIKRQTDVEEKIDVVYIHVKAENDFISWDRSYVMTYGLYNEGWILDDVATYDESNWKVRPLQGISDGTVQDYLETYKEENAFDSIELTKRTTALEEDGGEDKVAFQAIREHLYGTEILNYNQVWYFDEYSYGFSVVGKPQLTNRSIILNKSIVGAEWNNLARYYETNRVFQDQFDIKVTAMHDDELVLSITKKDIWAARWEGLDSPPETSTQITYMTLSYLGESGEVGFSLSPLSGLLYAPTEEDNFNSDDYFVFNLDKAGIGRIEKIYGDQFNRVIEKGIVSGKSTEEEATEYVISLARKYGMVSYDPENPICGIWDWDSDDSEFGNTIWCIWPDGTFDAYTNADDGYPLAKERIGELVLQGKWSYSENKLSFDGIRKNETVWDGNDTFELITEYSSYYRAHRVNYDVEGSNVQFSKPVQSEESNDLIDASGTDSATTNTDIAKEMLPAANSLSKLNVSLPNKYENGDVNYVIEIYKADNDAGYVFVTVGNGYGGEGTLKIITSMDAEGKIVQTQTLENKETAGLGSKITSDNFRNQFVGVNADTFEGGVDVIAGATRSSEYYFESIRSVFDAFRLITG